MRSPLLPALLAASAVAADVPRFRTQEIETGLGVGYAVLAVDVNRDKKADVVVVDSKRVVWYENPAWKRRTIVEGKTKPDNVSAAAFDVDGDGRVDLALGADWRPMDTKTGGTIQWLRQPENLDQPWTLHPIGEEPTVHRLRWVDVDGAGKPRLVVVPLMGRGSTKERNWTDGRPVRVLSFKIPADPAKDRWVPEPLDETLHVVHNFAPVPAAGRAGNDLLLASYEGVTLLSRVGDAWKPRRLHEGDQANPAGSRGASEIKQGKLKDGTPFVATIEPWHGDHVVVYLPPVSPADPNGPWRRFVLDDRLKWGHAVSCADLDGDGGDELVVGVRDNLSKKPGERCGVRVYQAVDPAKGRWNRTLLDEGGVAVEDLAVADLDGDGRPDVVASGRATKNVRIYWNAGPAK